MAAARRIKASGGAKAAVSKAVEQVREAVGADTGATDSGTYTSGGGETGGGSVPSL
jgi:hypothetical protein